MTAFADSQDVTRGVWGSLRLIIGGKDVTYFRGVPVEISSYQLTEPYSFGPAEFRFPQASMLEVDAWGTGDLYWLKNGATAVLKQVDAAGTLVDHPVIWRGIVTLPQVTSGGVVLQCDGEASGRLAMRRKLPDLFSQPRHVGRKVFDAFRDVRLTLTPYLGGDYGVKVDGRGYSGQMLDYVDGLLASTIGLDGSQYTVKYRQPQNDYHLLLKDTDTVDFTAFLGATGVDPDISSDLSEQPNSIYGSGVSPNGLVWVNGKYPGLMQGDPPAYPIAGGASFGEGTTDADTITGDGISVMLSKLVGEDYLDRPDEPGGFDADVTEAIKDLQDDAGLSQTGNMNTATWAALYDTDVTGFSLLSAHVAPLAQAPEVKKWNKTANGSLASRNPAFDPTVVQVDLDVDHGVSVPKSQGRRWSRGVLHRVRNQKNWAGTLTLTSDVFVGDVTSTTTGAVMSRLDIRPGMNLRLRHFDGGTKFHVSVVNVNSDLSVELGIDTQSRDAATLGEVIARNIASREHPARQWLRQRNANANSRFVEFSEVGGLVFNTITCPGGEWTVFPVVAGQAGQVARVRVQTTNNEAAFALAITAKKTGPGFWSSQVGNPLQGSPLDDIYLNKGGSGYTSAPSVVFTGGGGAGAAATATVSGGQVTGITLTSAGSGYAAPPTISFSGGGGSGAKAQAMVTLDSKWTSTHIRNLIDHDRALLGAWGTPDQPCGYADGSYTNNAGQLTGDPITGLFIDDGGFDYHTFGEPVVYVAIYPDRDTKIKPQRVLWDQLQSDV